MKRKKNQLIRSSMHATKFSNTNKIEKLNEFIEDNANAVREYTKYIWNNEIRWIDNKGLEHVFSLEKESYDLGSHIDYNAIKFNTKLSARALCSASNQAVGIVKSHSNKIIAMNEKLEWMEKTGKTEAKIEKYKARIQRLKNVEKIDLKNIYPELSSKCCDFIEDERYFNGWIELHSIGEYYGKILIPIKFHQHSNKLKEEFEMMTSFLIAPDSIMIRWTKDKAHKKSEGLVVGADPGANRVCTFSHIENEDNDEYKDCLKKISNKTKNSEAYKKAIKQRGNIVNKFINNIDFSEVKQINLEDNSTIHYKNYKGQFLSHYAYGEIKNKINSVAAEQGVLVSLQSSFYKSQRCSNCGWTQKKNRSGKNFRCCQCGLQIDADVNSSINQTCTLTSLPCAVKELKVNIRGFYWNSKGVFELTGTEFRVPYSTIQDSLDDFI